MIHKFKTIAVLCGAALLAAAMAPWTFSGAAMRTEIAREILKTTGLITETDGRAIFALLPRPRIKVENIRIQDRDGTLNVHAEYLRGNLRILPMFAGRLELASAALISPQIRIDADVGDFSTQSILARASAMAHSGEAAPKSAQFDRLGILSLVDGAATITSKARQFAIAVENINLTLDWRRVDLPASLQGSFLLNQDRAEVAAWLAKPADVLQGKGAELSVRISSEPLKFDMSGILMASPHFEYRGTLTATSPNLRKLAVGMERTLPLPGPLEAASLKGIATIQSSSFTISDLRLGVDKNTYDGALMLDYARERPLLSGTLAADSIELAPLFADIPAPIDADRLWSRERLPVPDLPPIDVDMRVSATRARLGRMQLRDAGFSMLLNDGQAEFSLAEAKAYNGILKGRLSAHRATNGYDMAATLTLQKIDSSSLFNDTFRSPQLNGEMNGEISLSGQGESPARILRSLNGQAQIALKSGDFSGLDLEQALRRLEKRPLSIASEVRSGRTNFNSAALDLQIDNGVAKIKRARADGVGVEINVTGAATIPDRTLELHLQATQTGADPAARENAPSLAMEITGGWDEPLLTLDARSLINRSQAAAPLLRGFDQAVPAAVSATGEPQ